MTKFDEMKLWHHYCKTDFLNLIMKKNFDSMMYGMRNKIWLENDSQKNTNCTAVSGNMINECNILVNSNIHDTFFEDEKLSVNKMLLVLIFLMVK